MLLLQCYKVHFLEKMISIRLLQINHARSYQLNHSVLVNSRSIYFLFPEPRGYLEDLPGEITKMHLDNIHGKAAMFLLLELPSAAERGNMAGNMKNHVENLSKFLLLDNKTCIGENV